MSSTAAARLQEEAAKLLSHLKNSFRVSQVAVDKVVSSVNELTDIFLDVIKVTPIIWYYSCCTNIYNVIVIVL